MHFVVATAAAMPRVEARVFAVSAENKSLSPVPVTEAAAGLPLPHGVRRRLYPVAGGTVGRALQRWAPDVVNLHFLALGGFASRSASALGAPLATTVHAVEPFLVERPRTLRERFLRDDARRAMQGSALLMPVSGYLAKWLVALGADASQIHTQYLGIDTSFWRPSTDPASRLRNKRILFVGHLTELKGVMDLLDVSHDLQRDLPHQLDIVGDGPLHSAVLEHARRETRITLHGTLSREGVRSILDQTSVLALPTKPMQGIEDAAPTVLLEAQSMGVPVITYNVGGTSEMVADRRSLVPSGDLDALRAGLMATLEDKEEFTGRSLAVRDWVCAKRSLKMCADQTREKLARLAI
jgi:glycosyltransferase involved in cell wall biosynthesis